MVGTIWGNARILALGLVLSMSLTGCLEETRKSSLTPDNTPVAPSSRPGILAPHTSPSSPGIPAPATPPSTSDGNIEPQIRGEPARIAVVGEVYEFQPEATDADGDRLTFSISGKPSWAAFDSDSGRLRGTPRDGDLGEAPADVVVRVTDGVHTKAWPKFRLAVAPQRKANYGHYFATRYSDTPADVAMLCEQAGVSGVVWRETWKDVEPSAGVYDFSGFDSVLAEIARSHNPQCQVWLFIEYKSFRNSVVKNPCPVYLQAAHSGLNADGNGAVTCFMWEPVMVQAYAAMMQAAAERFDANPRVEGIIFQESALGFNGPYSQDVADGGTYTPEAWRDALVDLIAKCGSSFLQSRCMAFMNFIRGKQAYLYDISAALAAVPNGRGCLSGPDLLPNSQPLYDTTSSVYEVLVRHDGCRSNSAQNDSYNVSGCGTDCIFRFAVSGTFGDFDAAAPRTSGLCVNSYLFWNHTVVRSSTGLDWTNALPVIAAYPYGKSWYEQCSNGGGAP